MAKKFTTVLISLSSLLCFNSGYAQNDDYSTWGESIPININTTGGGAGVATDQLNFPLLIRITDANKPHADFWGTGTQNAGQDIRFSKTSDITHHYYYEIDRWDNTNKLAEIWVRVDIIAGNSCSINYLTMHWDNNSAADSSSASSVFETSNGFIGAYHLDEETAGTGTADLYEDATGVNDGDDYVSNTEIGRAHV